MIGSFCTSLVAACSFVGTTAAQLPRPNVVVIVSDDQCVKATGCYEGSVNQTPNIDRIAHEGVRFTNAFVTNSLCGPSRATLLTGLYSHKNGFKFNEKADPFDGSQRTMPKMLQQAGYETAIFGKWHLQSTPTGFDHWLLNNGGYTTAKFYDSTGTLDLKGYSTDIITDHAIDFVKTHDADKPFYLQIAYNSPHRNWVPNEKYSNLYEDGDIATPATFDDDYATRSDAARQCHMSIEKDLNARDLKADPPADLTGPALKKWKYERMVKDYLRTIAAMDDAIGRVLKSLDDAGVADNTLILFTSDNGFFLGDHGWFDKRFMYEPSIRVPLLARLPRTIPSNKTADQIVINCDLMPTILDFAGVAVPSDVQGRSLKPILTGAAPEDWRKSMYYHYYELSSSEHNVQPHYGVRTERYKLIHFYDLKAWELYDLQSDPDELHNVYDDPKLAEVQKQLHIELDRQREALDDHD